MVVAFAFNLENNPEQSSDSRHVFRQCLNGLGHFFLWEGGSRCLVSTAPSIQSFQFILYLRLILLLIRLNVVLQLLLFLFLSQGCFMRFSNQVIWDSFCRDVTSRAAVRPSQITYGYRLIFASHVINFQFQFLVEAQSRDKLQCIFEHTHDNCTFCMLLLCCNILAAETYSCNICITVVCSGKPNSYQ